MKRFFIKQKAPKLPENNKPLLSPKTKRKIKIFFGTITFLAVFSFIFWLFVLLTNFYKQYDFNFQSPVTFHAPVIVIKRQDAIKKEIDERIKKMAPQPVTPTASASATPVPAYRFINMNKVPGSYRMGDKEQMAIINGQKHAGVIWRIYALESTYGKNDGCKDKGMVNGFGFGQDGHLNHRCYNSFADVVTDVNAWLESHLEKYSLAEALCGYNQGFNGEGFKHCVAQDPNYPYLINFFKV